MMERAYDTYVSCDADFRYDNSLTEKDNYQRFYDYFKYRADTYNEHKWARIFKMCELTDEVIKEEYDSEIKRLIDMELIEPPISSFHLYYISWKRWWCEIKNTKPIDRWNSLDNCVYFDVICYADLDENVKRQIKDWSKYYNEERLKRKYRLRKNMDELCHMYDDYKSKTVTVDMEEVNMLSLDWLALKTKFDEGADTSPIRYAISIKNLTEYLILHFENYVVEKADVLSELQKLSLPQELLPNVKKVRADLKNFNADAQNIYDQFINAGHLQDLNSANKEVYPPFSLVTETLTEKIRQVILRIELFETMPDFVRAVCEYPKVNGATTHVFRIYNDEISESAVTEPISDETISDLVSYVLDGHLRQEIVKKTAAERVLEILTSYRNSLNETQTNSDSANIDENIKRFGKICKSKLKEIDEILTDESEKIWLRINCIEKISD